MTRLPSALWLTASPHLKRLDQRLLCCLSKRVSIVRWEYMQTEDEPCSLTAAVDLLHEYISEHVVRTQKSVDLLGHGLSGIVGWLYAQRHPDHVRSLTLLSVSANPAVNWHAHYYALRQLLPCSREIILAQISRMLFGPRNHEVHRLLIQLLKQDLDTGLALHSLAGCLEIQPAESKVPLLVCQGAQDAVVGETDQWHRWLKPQDQVWACADGHHFFHFDHPRRVEAAILNFWQHIEQQQFPLCLSLKDSHSYYI